MSASHIQHVVVLMLENRSFDHMLGFMKHTDLFEGIPKDLAIPLEPHGKKKRKITARGRPTIFPDPAHSHGAVMRQLFLAHPPYTSMVNAPCTGAIWDYGIRIAGGKKKSVWQSIIGFFKSLFGASDPPVNKAEHIADCFPDPAAADETSPRILRTLAREFALCDHWHSSVPGETWPNRNFAHAATAAGEVNITLRPHLDTTIFEVLADHGRSARIYHDGPAQTWAYPKLWLRFFRGMDKFFDDVRNNNLPDYSFIEPRYYKLFRGYTNSQHPGNNSRRDADFLGAEELIAGVYSALRNNPAVWQSVLLLITYDEHGGFFEHVPPPCDASRFANGDRNKQFGFNYDLLGLRVPAVLVSPWIRRGTVDHTLYDHTCIIKSVRQQFGIPGSFNERERQANSFWHNLTNVLRSDSETPVLPPAGPDAAGITGLAGSVSSEPPELDTFHDSLVAVTQYVDEWLDRAKSLEAAGGTDALIALSPATMRAPQRFASEAELNAYLRKVTNRMRAVGA
jgi:phospholipase C